MNTIDLLLGKRLATAEARAEQVGPGAGIPIFGLDALSSAAYGPEAALTLLIPVGLAGVSLLIPITGCIVLLLIVVYFSYRQTIGAYPGGGGSYTVARQNLGARMGLLAAAALMIDYILVVAVGISAGVGALVSAVPSLQNRTLVLCLGILLLITLVNLRGVREAGTVFMVPTYAFLACLLIAILLGLEKVMVHHGHPMPVVSPPASKTGGASVTAWVVLQAFAAGCTALTGVEAVSNGVKAFRAPATVVAKRTLTIIISTLIVLLLGIAYLVKAYGITATEPGGAGYQSLLSMLLAAVVGRGVFYYVSIASILAVLALSANTAFADFPRLCRSIAQNGYLPRSFSIPGRRLVFSQGIYVLAVLSGLLLVVFGGVTDRLIPLFAVGAFLAFTLSQAGMVAHWRRLGGRMARRSMVINGLGALVTGLTVGVILVAKFLEGAWLTLLLIPSLVAVMVAVRRHYHRVALEVRCFAPLDVADLVPPIVIVPVNKWGEIARKALAFAVKISPEVRAVHVEVGEETDTLKEEWAQLVELPSECAGLARPELVILPSPYRTVVFPIVEYVHAVEGSSPDRQIAVVIPELVEQRWYHHVLHNKRASLLKALLLMRGTPRTVVINVPWYLGGKETGHAPSEHGARRARETGRFVVK